MESRKNLDAFKEQYDILNAEDKVMDRSFKREFNDVTAVQQDQLYRLFRKRPRIPRLKGFDTPAPPTASDSTLPNPFADRPSTARQHSQAKHQLDGAINEMDKDVNCPEGVEPHVWQRLCQYRREKIENDLLVRIFKRNFYAPGMEFGGSSFCPCCLPLTPSVPKTLIFAIIF